MSKQVVEKIKRIAKKPFKTCYKCYQDLEAGKTGEIPDCCNDCELFKEWVPLDNIMGLLDGCVLLPKKDDLAKQLAEKMRIDIEKRLKAKGICENSDYVIIDKKQGKFIVLEKEKLKELADLLKTRPRKKSMSLWTLASPDAVDVFESYFEKLENVVFALVVELTEKERKNKMKEPLLLSDEALRKRYTRTRFRDLGKLHALVDCRQDYLDACWNWVYLKAGRGLSET